MRKIPVQLEYDPTKVGVGDSYLFQNSELTRDQRFQCRTSIDSDMKNQKERQQLLNGTLRKWQQDKQGNNFPETLAMKQKMIVQSLKFLKLKKAIAYAKRSNAAREDSGQRWRKVQRR